MEYIEKAKVMKLVEFIVEELAESSLDWQELKDWVKEKVEELPISDYDGNV